MASGLVPPARVGRSPALGHDSNRHGRATGRSFTAVGVGFGCVSFQITVLKVLAGSPEGCLPLADLRHDVALLVSSGRDWRDLTKRIAARAPDLDIFSQTFVVREPTGWQITAAGRAFLASVERPVQPLAPPAEAILTEADVSAMSSSPTPPLIGVRVRRQRGRRRRARAGRSAAA
jgi:hypothetical protein